jgi:hypothetical protein
MRLKRQYTARYKNGYVRVGVDAHPPNAEDIIFVEMAREPDVRLAANITIDEAFLLWHNLGRAILGWVIEHMAELREL